MDTLIGTVLGGYTLLRSLGSGGMGTVYLAEDTSIGQQVAIKVVRTDDAEYPDATSVVRANDRFRQEARAVAGLDHLHILPLYRYGEEETENGQRAYMIMQYRPEGSLWDWLRQRASLLTGASLQNAPRLPAGLPTSWPVGIEEGAEYLRQAASALQYAHDRGLVHRDVKPANFLLRIDPNNAPGAGNAGSTGYHVSLLLSDFGLAKLFSATSATSSVFGTPTYMAPEQFEGISGPESDQYALAVMIYYMLAGRPPFEGEPMRLMHQHIVADPPPIRGFAPSLSAGVESVLNRALAKKPIERYPSIAAFAEAFTQQTYKMFHSPDMVPPFSLPMLGKESRNSFSASLPAVNPASAASPYSAPTVQASIPLAHVTPELPTVLNANSAPTVFSMPPTVTPQQFGPAQGYPSAYQASQPLVKSLPYPPRPLAGQPASKPVTRRSALGWILGGTAIVALGTTADVYFSVHKGALPGVTSTGTSTQVQYILKGHTEGVTSVAWSPDGQQLVSASRDRTARIWSVATQQNTVTFKGHSAGLLTAAWSPDGALLASGGRDKQVQIWNTAGTGQLVRNLEAVVSSLAWLDPQHLFIGTLGRGIHELLLANGAVTLKSSVTSVRAVAVSPDNKNLAVGFENGAVSVISLTTKHKPVSYYPHGTTAINTIAWSPDSTLLASGGADAMANVFEPNTGHIVRSMKHNGAVNGVAWEPNNSGRLATASSDKLVRIWSADGSSSTSYTGHTQAVTSMTWSTQGGLASASMDHTILVWKI